MPQFEAGQVEGGYAHAPSDSPVPASWPPWLTTLLLRLAGLVVLLACWEGVAHSGWVDPVLVAAPSEIASVFIDVVTSDIYWSAFRSTLELLAKGFGIAVIVGVGLGVLLGRVRIVDRAVGPYMNALYSAPIPVIIPFVTALLGYRMGSMLFIVAVMGVFDLFANTYQGVRETDRELQEVGRSFNASELQMWRFIVIPYALPYLALGLKLGMARALIGTILAEFYVSPSGLGYMIIAFGRRFDMARMFVPVLTFTFLGLIFVGAISYVVNRLEGWRTT